MDEQTTVVWLLEGGNYVHSHHVSRRGAEGWISAWAGWVQDGRPSGGILSPAGDVRWRVITGDAGGGCEWAIAIDKVISAYVLVRDSKPTPQERAAAAMEKMVKVDGDEWKENG